MSLSPFFATTLPINIKIDDWICSLIQDLPTIYFPIFMGFKRWQEWASQVVVFNDLSNCPLPIGPAFAQPEDWRKWGCYFLTSITSSTLTANN